MMVVFSLNYAVSWTGSRHYDNIGLTLDALALEAGTSCLVLQILNGITTSTRILLNIWNSLMTRFCFYKWLLLSSKHSIMILNLPCMKNTKDNREFIFFRFKNLRNYLLVYLT